MSEAYPLILKPTYKHYLWGGRKIIDNYLRKENYPICAESWEASDRSDGMTLISNGQFKGWTLKKLIERNPHFFSDQTQEKFPLLIKLIDAQQSLSIQVHPSDEAAEILGGEPKSEMWYILDAQPKSYIYLGLNKKLTKDELMNIIQNQQLEQYMNRIEVKKGDTYFIPGGLIHSIGAGCLIYEVQQNSNTTYRLYDWGRKDAMGRLRELNIEKGMLAMNPNQIYTKKLTKKKIEDNDAVKRCLLLKNPFFSFYEWELKQNKSLDKSPHFRIFFVTEGEIKVETPSFSETLSKGCTCLLPSNLSKIMFSPVSSSVGLLESHP